MSDTQDEGEDFDVDWVLMTQAASRCSFDDDERIVEKALETVSGLDGEGDSAADRQRPDAALVRDPIYIHI